MDKSSIVRDFNSMVLDLASQLAFVCPTSIIANNMDILRQIIKRKQESIIDIFVMYILKYKRQIDAGDDNFFLNNSFDSELKDSNSELIKKVFEFKSLWLQLNQDNRDTVKQYMKLLCELSLAYIS